MKTLAALVVLLAAGCASPAPTATLDPGSTLAQLPAAIHDEQEAASDPSTICEVPASLPSPCFAYAFDLEIPAGLNATLAIGSADRISHLWVSRGSETIAANLSGARTSASELSLSRALQPGSYELHVATYSAFTLDASFEPIPRAGDASATVAAYLHDVSQPIEGLTIADAIVEQHWIPGEDGVLLDTWVARPDVDFPVPIVLFLTPYYGGGPPVHATLSAAGQDGFNPIGGDLLFSRGYALAISSLRGTGNSGGCFTIGGASEARDSAAVIEALAAMPWANGNVGLIGVSYDGTTPQDVWVEAPPALKTIVPISGNSELYKYSFVNGVPFATSGQSFNVYYWAIFGAPLVGAGGGHFSVPALDPAPWATTTVDEACAHRVESFEAGTTSALDGDKDAYWQERDFLAELRASPDKPRASVFYVHGLEDWNVKPHNMEDWLDALWDSGVPMKAWLGQWDHATPTRDDWRHDVIVAWFDQFLKGVDTGILDAPRVQVRDDAGVWRHEERWPPQDVAWRTLHPDSDGTLRDEPGDGTVSYLDADPHGLQGMARDAPRDMVVWESDPLSEDWHLAGQPVFEANVTTTAKRGALVLTLVERTAEGDRSINYAAMSLNHVASLEEGDPDVSGLTQLVRVRFFPQDDVVRAGSRLVLVAAGNLVHNGGASVPFASSTTGPDLVPPMEGGTITIDLAGASLTLPLDVTIVPESPQPGEYR